MPPCLSIICITVPTTTAAHVKSYNDVSRWNLFTMSHHLPGSIGLVTSCVFVDHQIDVGRSATLGTVESEPSGTAFPAGGTVDSVNSRVDHVEGGTTIILLKPTLLQQTRKPSDSRRIYRYVGLTCIFPVSRPSVLVQTHCLQLS